MNAAAVFIVACTIGPGQVRDVGPPIAAATATIRGIVTSDEARPRPLRRARVTVEGRSLQVPRTVITGDDGRFVFDALPAGGYTIAAVKEAYVASSQTASRTVARGQRLTLRAGETQTLTLRLRRGAVLTGVVTDVDGLPAQGVQVSALALRLIAVAGERRLAPAGVSSSTDDRGVFRIFGLPPGEYVISAQPLQRFVGIGVPEVRTMAQGTVSPRPLSMSVIYYPGSTDLSRAQRVPVAAGEERAGIDVQLQYLPLATVSGLVPIVPGSTPPAVTMARLGEMTAIDSTRIARAEPDGRFVFTSVPPGTYVLFARSVAPSPVTTSGSPQIVPSGPSQWSTAEVVVEGEDLTGVALSAQPSITIAGRLAFEGTRPAPDVSGISLPPFPAGQMIGTFQAALPQVQLLPGGRFAIEGIMPGAYKLGVPGQALRGIRAPIGSWWLKSIVIDGRDVLDAPLDLRQGADAAVATFSDQASEISGAVKDAQGAPATEGYVVVFSADRAMWFFNSRRVAGVRLGAGGQYTIRNLPPGDYRAVATADLDNFEWFDPAALERLVPAATAVTIAGSEQRTVDLAIR